MPRRDGNKQPRKTTNHVVASSMRRRIGDERLDGIEKRYVSSHGVRPSTKQIVKIVNGNSSALKERTGFRIPSYTPIVPAALQSIEPAIFMLPDKTTVGERPAEGIPHLEVFMVDNRPMGYIAVGGATVGKMLGTPSTRSWEEPRLAYSYGRTRY